MIVDFIINLGMYEELVPYTQEILAFIDNFNKKELKDGKYSILNEDLIALVQTYSTKCSLEQRMESHKKYIDLQYIVCGEEIVYWDSIENLQIEEDEFLEKDIAFYKKKQALGEIKIIEKMFVYFLKHDAHMPSCQVESSKEVKKIVFKIKNRGE